MSIVDSAAAFERKCEELKGGDELFDGLEKLGVSDFSTLAFALGTPQKAPSDDQFTELAGRVFSAPTLGQMALLRKLHFEATTLMVASINEQVKSDSADPAGLTKRLPAAEKQSRLEAQSKRLAGLKIAGELAPSHQLLDAANAMVESEIITWIAPSKCSKRDDEVQANIKPSASTLQIEQSTLRVAQVPVVTSADVGSELKLQWALQRRGLAMDHSFISFIHSFNHSFIHSFISFIHSFIISFISFISFIHSFHSFIHSFHSISFQFVSFCFMWFHVVSFHFISFVLHA